MTTPNIYFPRLADRPADCTCDGYHTDAAPGIDTATLISLRDWPFEVMCPAEKRALNRIIVTRRVSL